MSDDDLTLGPFYANGVEILPCTTEATDAAIEQIMGTYRLVSNIPNLTGGSITVTPRAMTAFIQADWDRAMADDPDEGFLLAYLSSQKAVGRLAEQLICAELFNGGVLPQDAVREVVPVKEAVQRCLLVPVRQGVRCDDLLVLGASDRKYLVEVKASFIGRGYLSRCLPKAMMQLAESLRLNAELHGALLVLASIRMKSVAIMYVSKQDLGLRPAAHWIQVAKGLLCG